MADCPLGGLGLEIKAHWKAVQRAGWAAVGHAAN